LETIESEFQAPFAVTALSERRRTPNAERRTPSTTLSQISPEKVSPSLPVCVICEICG
jgi:hypothetical protein